MTVAFMVNALVLHLPAYGVKGATKMPAMSNQDTVQFGWEEGKDAIDMETWGQDIHARWLSFYNNYTQ